MEILQNKFAFFANFAETIRELPIEKQGRAYQALCEYGIYGILPDDESLRTMCLMARASLFKEDGRKSNGGNHNPTGKNQYTKPDGQSGQSWSKLVKVGQSGQSLSETETETETETEIKEKIIKKKIEYVKFLGEKRLLGLSAEQWEYYQKHPSSPGVLVKAIDILESYALNSAKRFKQYKDLSIILTRGWAFEEATKAPNQYENQEMILSELKRVGLR